MVKQPSGASGRRRVAEDVRWALALHEGTADSVLVVLEDCGHLGHLEEPDTFTNTIVNFTRNLVT
jgi:proline iminopeptidase